MVNVVDKIVSAQKIRFVKIAVVYLVNVLKTKTVAYARSVMVTVVNVLNVVKMPTVQAVTSAMRVVVLRAVEWMLTVTISLPFAKRAAVYLQNAYEMISVQLMKAAMLVDV